MSVLVRHRPGHPLRYFLRKEPEYTVERGEGGQEGARSVRFLGTAGFEVLALDRQIVIDPYLTRCGLAQTFFGRIEPDEGLLAREIPRATEVLVGHSHHDHAIDAPAVCRQTGARLLGSRSTLNIARAYGLDAAQHVEVEERPGGHPVQCGEVVATALRSRHGRVFANRVPYPGHIPVPPPWPPRARDLRHGAVFNWHLELAGTSFFHVDSADFIEDELEGRRAHVLALCAIGRAYRPDYTRRIVEILRPEVVIPCHWDDFTLPYDAPPRQLPGVDVEGFGEEIRAAGARAVVLGFGQRWSW